MTAQKYCKSKGLTIQILSEYTGLKPRRLFDWWNTQNKAFKVLVDGWLMQSFILEAIEEKLSKTLSKEYDPYDVWDDFNNGKFDEYQKFIKVEDKQDNNMRIMSQETEAKINTIKANKDTSLRDALLN